MEVITLIAGLFVGFTIGYSACYSKQDRLNAIEKELHESYRGETFEKRAKRVSK